MRNWLIYGALTGGGVLIGLVWGLVTGVHSMGDGRFATRSGVCFYCLMHGRVCRPGR
jgi:hypothetical protein